MAFVALGGAGGGRPTFFEMVAAERLMLSLKSAAAYSLSVRKRWIQRP
jgi:peroxin-12